MCKKQTSVSHSSTESEIISLDAGLRLDGISLSICGIWLFLSLETQFRLLIDRGKPLWTVTKIKDHTNDLKEWSTCWIILIVCPQTSNFRIKKLCCIYFEDNEAVIKMIIKGKRPAMRHVSRTHRVALHWLFDPMNLDPKIQIKYIDTKNQLADIVTKGNFTRAEWNHMLCLFNVIHFCRAVCSEAMAKRLQRDSGEERVAAKSRPMMSLIARVPSNISSSTSESPGKRSYGNQNPWSAKAEREDRPGQPVVGSDTKTASDYYHEQSIGKLFLSTLLKAGR